MKKDFFPISLINGDNHQFFFKNKEVIGMPRVFRNLEKRIWMIGMFPKNVINIIKILLYSVE
jgi:hypothetical protein